ncbi:prepilin-type N-terminal cleavage/methylation domain-containing protein [Clostridium sp. MB05]|uniref:prepilin-type N-terminal cleavage/methylation domain-containing protein n=1 Tax=Clostridium sp. MB05 TaxID=3376682 RepID=UPI003981AD65
MIKNANNKKKKRGFTLIELIIVIAIIAILAAIAIPKFGDVRKKANISADIANAKQIQGAVSTVIADGTVELPANELTFTFDGTAEGSDKIETALKEQLQDSIPKLKVKNDKATNFTVIVSKEGKTTIKAGDLKVYPTGEGVYAE